MTGARRPFRLRLAIACLHALTLVAVLAAVAGLAMRAAVNRINADPQPLLAGVGAALGGQLTVADFAAGFSRFEPVLRLADVALVTNVGETPALAIQRLEVQIDPWESIWRGGPVASALVADGVVVHLAQRSDGSWGLRGTPGGGAAPPLEPLERFFGNSDAVHLAGGTVHLVPLVGPDATVHSLDLALDNTWGFHRGSLRGAWAGGGDGTLDARFRLRGDDLWVNQWGTVWLQLAGVDLGWWSGLGRLAATTEPPLAGQLDGFEGWLQVHAGQPVLVHGAMAAPELMAPSLAGGRPLHDLEVDGQLQWLDGGWQFAARQLSARHRTTALDLGGLRVAGGDGVWHLTLPALGISDWLGVLDREGVLGTAGRRVVADLQPQGVLGNFRGQIDLRGERPRWICTASISDLQLTAHKAAPGVRGGDAQLVLSDAGGFIDVADDEVWLHFANVYDEGITLADANGRLWLGFGDGAFRLHSGPLAATLSGEQLFGRFGLYRTPDAEERTLTLMLGSRNVAADGIERYLPAKLSPGLRRWLAGSVKAGDAHRVGLLVHGQVRNKPGYRRRSLDLFADATDVRLQFHPEWPALTGMTTAVRLGHYGLVADASGTDFAGIALPRASAVLVREPGATLDVRASAALDAAQVLMLLRDTPLRRAVPVAALPWQASGALTAELAMSLQLANGVRVAALETRAVLDDVALAQPQWDLAVDRITGPLRYRAPSGFNSPGLTARWRDAPLDVQMSGGTDGTPVRLGLAATAEPAMLRDWLGLDWLARIGAPVPWQGALLLPVTGGPVRLEARSDLLGVPLLAPAPLGKSAAEVLPLELAVTFQPDATDVSLQLGDVLDGLLQLRADAPVRASLALGMAAPALPDDGIRITGQVEALDGPAWLAAVLDPGNLGPLAAPAVASGPADAGAVVDPVPAPAPAPAPAPVTVAGLQVSALGLGPDTALAPVLLDIAHAGNGWLLGFNGDHVEGRLLVPDDGGVPQLELTNIHLPEVVAGAGAAAEIPAGQRDEASPEAAAAVVDPLAGVTWQDVPELDVLANRVQLAGESFGAWRFRLRQSSAGLVLQDLEAQVRGLTISGWPEDEDAAPGGAEVLWAEGGNTRFRGTLAGDNLADVLVAWGVAPSVESERMTARARVRWPGSPAAVALQQLTGEVVLDVRDGRFLEVDTAGGGGAMRVLGILDFTAIARRARLDFSDVFQRGVTFDSIRGTVRMEQGLLQFPEPLEISGPGSRFRLQGTVNLGTGALDNDMVVTLPVNRTLPWYAAYAALFTNPLAGAGVLVAERLFRNQIEAVSSARYRITGTLDAPEVAMVAVFDNSMQEVKVDDLPDLTTDPNQIEDPGAHLPAVVDDPAASAAATTAEPTVAGTGDNPEDTLPDGQ